MDMKDIAIIYGGAWIGKGIDKLITNYAPVEAQTAKVLLATVLPLMSIVPKIPEIAQTVSLIAGAFIATKL
ncbi:MAG: hypothetical protein KKD44_26690 [Proteobacteria bacterium]|nr:hypothetical protein [Pseudomonadota bacterium]